MTTTPTARPTIDVARAVAATGHWAHRLGWHADKGRIGALIGVGASTDPARFVEATARWQASNGLHADGIIGPKTWAAMSRVLSGGPRPQPPRAPAGTWRTTSWLRQAWAGHECGTAMKMASMSILGRTTPVHPWTVEAWRALERQLTRTGYRASSVWNYNCRGITSGKGLSLHAYGLATDIDPRCNPFLRTSDRRAVRFSPKSTQQDRCADVRAQLADTAFSPTQIAAVESIRSTEGIPALAWGGNWSTVKDAMHFQINLSPAELRRGLVVP